MEIIGEAAYMLSLDFKDQHPQVEWEQIVRMRHVLVHGYYQISLALVWSVIQDDLVELKPLIEQFLQDIFLQIVHTKVHLLQHNLEQDLHLILQFLIQISFKQILHITSDIFFLHK